MVSKKEMKVMGENNGGKIAENKVIFQELKEIKSDVKEVKKFLNNSQEKNITTPNQNKFPIQEIPIQPKTLELCPKCSNICQMKATDYRNTRCWKITCQNCNHLSYATQRKSN
jgi:hypothetical protein